MSLIGARVNLPYLCVIERDANAATANSWGSPNEPDWSFHTEVPCTAWINAAREAAAPDRTIVVEDMKVSLPKGTDVTTRDRVAVVTNKLGETHFSGPLDINSAQVYADHIELSLERIHGG